MHLSVHLREDIMPEFGSCGHCKNGWYTICTTGKLRVAKHIPTCPEGSIMAVCDECFDRLPSSEIIRIAQHQYRETAYCVIPDEGDIAMSPTEHALVDTAIRGWVLYMKGEAGEPPFEEEPLTW